MNDIEETLKIRIRSPCNVCLPCNTTRVWKRWSGPKIEAMLLSSMNYYTFTIHHKRWVCGVCDFNEYWNKCQNECGLFELHSIRILVCCWQKAYETTNNNRCLMSLMVTNELHWTMSQSQELWDVTALSSHLRAPLMKFCPICKVISGQLVARPYIV